MLHKREGETMEQYLMERVFSNAASSEIAPDPAGSAGFAKYLDRYKACLAAENAAAQLK